MSCGEARIVLQPGGLRYRLRTLLRRGPTAGPRHSGKVDHTLVGRVASQHVRRFVESIDTYQLLSRNVVQVFSAFRVPDQPGIRQQLPVWLSERIRFGIVTGDGSDFRYVSIRSIEMRWDEETTELRMHLDERIVPGTRAFIAAYLGEGVDTQALQDLPLATFSGGHDR